MKRNVSFEEISDNRKYKASDLVKVSCNGCLNCSECCEFTDDTIFLDPYDVYQLEKGLGKSFEEMIGKSIELTVCDGIVTPYLKKNDTTHSCVFLSEEKRCQIHSIRPGFCRLFPLGRIYNEEGDFDYFIQIHECPYPDKTKVKVKQWLGIERLPVYEDFIRQWHEITCNISACFEEDPASLAAKSANMKLLNTFFVNPYDTKSDFYNQFAKRKESFMS